MPGTGTSISYASTSAYGGAFSNPPSGSVVNTPATGGFNSLNLIDPTLTGSEQTALLDETGTGTEDGLAADDSQELADLADPTDNSDTSGGLFGSGGALSGIGSLFSGLGSALAGAAGLSSQVAAQNAATPLQSLGFTDSNGNITTMGWVAIAGGVGLLIFAAME
jgi:hypothetical protein